MPISGEEISVVVPCYNKSAHLHECLQSALSQSVKPKEIVVIDDGSTDGSVEIARSIALNHPAVKIYQKPNGGVSDARNYGIERAVGGWITALDADDKMEPTYLDKAIRNINAHGANLISCAVQMFGEGTDEWLPEKYAPYVERYHNVIPTLVTYNKDLWRGVGGYSRSFVFNEDWDFFIKAEQLPLIVAHIPEKLFLYRVDSKGLASQYIKDTWNFSVSLVMTSNEAKYPLEKLYKAHTSLSVMPKHWIERFEKQFQQYSDEWLLAFWLGLNARTKGEVETAKELFRRSIDLSGGRNWQPFFSLALMAKAEGNSPLTLECFDWVRLLRPDTEEVINQQIKSLNSGPPL